MSVAGAETEPTENNYHVLQTMETEEVHSLTADRELSTLGWRGWWEASLMWSDEALNTNKLSQKDASKQLSGREDQDHRAD